MSVTKTPFGRSREGKELSLYTIENSKGTKVKVTDLGATVVSIIFQDKNETYRDVILGYDSPEGYYENSCYFGACIGRSGNRIAGSSFRIGDREYRMTPNENENNLHSGPDGFDRRVFETVSVGEDQVKFAITDPDGKEGFPGDFRATVTYRLSEENEFFLIYGAACDQTTVCNMTNHTYFNLGGHDSGSIENTVLWLGAKNYTPVADSKSIPTGEIASVAGTPFDFTEPKTIGRDISADNEQLRFTGGYDHNFCIQQDKGLNLKFAEAYCPKTGICMEAFTDLPGVQFYAGNFITEGMKGKGGAVYGKRNGFCLESQFYPNSINQDGFAKPILEAGKEFRSTTCYRFSVR